MKTLTTIILSAGILANSYSQMHTKQQPIQSAGSVILLSDTAHTASKYEIKEEEPKREQKTKQEKEELKSKNFVIYTYSGKSKLLHSKKDVKKYICSTSFKFEPRVFAAEVSKQGSIIQTYDIYFNCEKRKIYFYIDNPDTSSDLEMFAKKKEKETLQKVIREKYQKK